MSEAMEALEHAEHASHAAHGDHGAAPGKANPKLVGLTMALIGVMIAFCAAMVGGERNELTRTMIEQTQANADASSASIKFRLVMLEIEKQRGALAIKPEAEPSGLTKRFIKLWSDYSKERKISAAWAGSYGPLVKAHFEGAEGYEHAQLIAEIGIVLASLAVLLGLRVPWILSLVLAVVCVAQLGRTFVHTRNEVNESTDSVTHNEEAYHELRAAHTKSNDDDVAVDALDPGSKLRTEIEGTGEAPTHTETPAAPVHHKE